MIEVIQRDVYDATCHVCGTATAPRWGIPVWQGRILPDDWPGSWCGQDACQPCYAAQRRLTAPMGRAAFRRARVAEEGTA